MANIGDNFTALAAGDDIEAAPLDGNFDDIKDLQKKIIFAYHHREILQEKAEKAFNTYQKIKWSVMAENYCNLIKSL